MTMTYNAVKRLLESASGEDMVLVMSPQMRRGLTNEERMMLGRRADELGVDVHIDRMLECDHALLLHRETYEQHLRDTKGVE